jgi:hypothetical protein
MDEKTEDPSSERRPIRVAIRQEDIDDVRAHPRIWFLGQTDEDVEGQTFSRGGLGQTEEDVEGQVYLMSPNRKGGPDDTEGQSARWGLEPVGADDTEGQTSRWGLEPVGADDVEGQNARWGFLNPADDGNWTLELDDDTEGQSSRWGG